MLPWLVLAVLFIGFYGRVLRSNILDTINEDYVRTAKAKGLAAAPRAGQAHAAQLADPDRHAVRARLRRRARRRRDPHRDGLRPARASASTPPQSIQSLDLPPIMGVTIYGAFFIVFFSVVVDVAYAWLDPRIRPT